MQVHPTRSASHLAVSGCLVTVLGVALGSAPMVAWGGALLIGLSVARAVTELGVARIRAAGFEMLWRTSERSRRIGRGETIELEAELRNRDARAARYVSLRAVAAPGLLVRLSPDAGEVPASGLLRVKLQVVGQRVGRHAVHGLSLELRGGPGLFEVPLTFANPFGIEVLPRAYTRFSRSARGGRSRRDSDEGRPRPLSGDSLELRELRKYQSGDPFRRIAWKASARRGNLLVREYERDEHDVVFLLLDAAVELAAGVSGESAMDRMLDEAATVAVRHVARGDDVGLGIIGRRALAWILPDRGVLHETRLLETLAHAISPVNADRSGLDEAEVALRVLEHMRPLDPELAANVSTYEIDGIARRAEKLVDRAPFPGVSVHAASPREAILRGYLEAFGMGSPLRTGPDRVEVDELLVAAIARAQTFKPKPSLIYLWSPAPEAGTRLNLVQAATRRRTRRPELLWASVPLYAGMPAGGGYSALVRRTLERRARLSARTAERALHRVGVRVEKLSADVPTTLAKSSAEAEAPTPGRERLE